MSEGGGDPVALALARLELAVERLASGLSAAGAAGGARPFVSGGESAADVAALRAEVASLAARLDASIARLREVVRAESEPGGGEGRHGPDEDEEG